MSRRANKVNRNSVPQQQLSQSNLDLGQADDITCQSCGNFTFVPVVLLKKVSAIMSPTGQEAAVPIQVFACNACGFINKEFLPRFASHDESADDVSIGGGSSSDQDTTTDGKPHTDHGVPNVDDTEPVSRIITSAF